VLAELEGRELAPTRLPDVQTVHAMTVHKSQGSQAEIVSVIMPPEDSRLLTRELFYTAVTRAQKTLRVVGTEASVRAAINRKVQRASGLRERLRDALGGSAALG
jgi:exodeoxyribonuclease V alpha subunit